MTLTIPASALSAALSSAAKIVETKNTLPLLAMVIFQGQTITTSNLDIEYRQELTDAEGSLTCAVDAKRLAAWASVASGTITLTLDKHILTAKAGRSRLSLPALPVDDFPLMPVDKLCPALKIDGAALASHLNRTVWAASTESTRFYLVGVFLNDEGGKARMVATDSHRLASLATDVKWPKGAPDVIIPTSLVTVIASAAKGPCALAWDNSKMQLTAGNVTIIGKMIEGGFPDYRRVIPLEPTDNPIGVDAAELMAAVKRVSIASDAQVRTLRMKPIDGALSIRIEGTSGFEGEDEVQAECTDGHEGAINANLLVSVLSNADVETFAIEQATPTAPFVFRPVSQSPGSSFIAVVMPLRI